MNYGLIITCLLLLSCTPTTSLIQNNQDDDSVRFYAKRVNKGKISKTKHLKGLENAYQSANSVDWYLVDSLQKCKGNAYWPAINMLHQRIKEREEKVAALLPLASKDGYVPKFAFTADLPDIEMQSRKKAAAYLYHRAETLLDMAKSGNRLIAREAYAVLLDLKKNYFSDWADTDDRMAEARELGTTFFLVETEGGHFYSQNFWDDFFMQGTGILENKWQYFDRNPVPGRLYHYTLNLHLTALDPGSETRMQTSNIVTREVQDGEIVKKDSTGTVIERTPVMISVSGTRTELTISKTGNAGIYATLRDNHTGAETYWDSFEERFNYSETTCSITGDERAFPDVHCSGASAFGAPDDWSIVREMAGGIRQQLNHFIWWYAGNM